MTPETLRELQERLAKASGPDRELDFLIANALYQIGGEAWGYAACDVHPENGPEVIRLTASLDAAMALVERVLPEWCCSAIKTPGGCEGYIWRVGQIGAHEGTAPTPALALLSAMLSALSNKGEEQ